MSCLGLAARDTHPSQPDTAGLTPLDRAVLSFGWTQRERAPAVTDRRPLTAYEQLLWAGACGGEPEIVELCLPRIDRAPSDPWWSQVLRQPMRIWNHGPLDGPGFDRNTYPRCLEVILGHGADPDATDHHGFTALQQVAQPVRRGDDK